MVLRETKMSLKTRLDGRSKDNNSLQIKDDDGKVIVEIKVLDKVSTTLDIVTAQGLHIEKPNGWRSK